MTTGQAIGRYELEEQLGAGGMATVYRARDRELRREVAVKVLLPHMCENRDVVARFQREARAAAALDDAHILRVFDVGGGEGDAADADRDPPYIVLELVRGNSLREHLAGRSPPPAEIAACIGAVVAAALARAHAAGIIHRDVKPANILVAEQGRLLLGDFGVARVADEESLVTRTGALIGTPSFMSPEQAMGDDLDPRSDLYSLGATLYRIATGVLPFSGPTPRVVAAIAQGELTAPLRRNPKIGPDLNRVIDRLMALEPADRYPDAAAAEEALAGVARAAGIDDPDEILAEYFADPDGCAARVTAAAVAASLARAEAEAAAGALPHATALLDRVLSIDPDSAGAKALLARIAAGRRRARWRWLAAGVVVVAAAAVGVGLWPRGGPREQALAAGSRDAGSPARAAPAPAAPPAVRRTGKAAPAGLAGSERPAGRGRRAPPDAPARPARPPAEKPAQRSRRSQRSQRSPRPRPIRRRRLHRSRSASARAGRAPVRLDAAPAHPVARAAAARPDAAAPPAPARLTLLMNAWCDVTIDGRPYGRADRRHPISLAPGRHRVVCSQGPGMPSWSASITLAPGQKKTLRGEVLRPVAVRIAVSSGNAVRLEGRVYRNGARVELRPDRYPVEILAGGRRVGGGWLTLPRAGSCVLRDRPQLGCY